MLDAVRCRTEHAGQVHRVVPQRDHAAGAVAAALPARRLHPLQGTQYFTHAHIICHTKIFTRNLC